MRRLLAALALALLPLPAHAVPITEPTVFDFEDGLQGWELHGAATRVQTQLLGGEWAIFGDGFVDTTWTHIFLTIDLTSIGAISVEQFLVDGDERWLALGLFFDTGDGLVLAFEPGGPGNPSVRVFDLSGFTGTAKVFIEWAHVGGTETESLVAFIDNITFHPVPEPSTLALLALGLVALGVGRHRIM